MAPSIQGGGGGGAIEKLDCHKADKEGRRRRVGGGGRANRAISFCPLPIGPRTLFSPYSQDEFSKVEEEDKLISESCTSLALHSLASSGASHQCEFCTELLPLFLHPMYFYLSLRLVQLQQSSLNGSRKKALNSCSKNRKSAPKVEEIVGHFGPTDIVSFYPSPPPPPPPKKGRSVKKGGRPDPPN